MRVLITWGSKRGGTEGIARALGDALSTEGHDVRLLPPSEAARAADFDAAIVGGALYAGRWHHAARRFVNRREKLLRRVPVWFFSSGPLDDSADARDIAPTPQVRLLMDRVGAQGHATFGGRLTPDARGFPASAMAKKHAGDWRNQDRIRRWGVEIARALPTARPGVVIEQPGRAPLRLIAHGLVGWVLCAAAMGALLEVLPLAGALLVHAFVAPLLFAIVAHHYHRVRGARDPLPTAAAFTAIVALLDAIVVAALIQHSPQMLGSFLGFWLPLVLIFVVTWMTGEIAAMVVAARSMRPQTT